MRNHPGRRILTEILGNLFNAAYKKSASSENALAGVSVNVEWYHSIVKSSQIVISLRRGSCQVASASPSISVNGDNSMPTAVQTPLDVEAPSRAVQIPSTSGNTRKSPTTTNVSHQSGKKPVICHLRHQKSLQVPAYKRKLIAEKEASDNKAPKKPNSSKSQSTKAKKPKAAKKNLKEGGYRRGWR